MSLTLYPASSGGSGDVVGPASSTDNAVARYDSTTGKLLQNSTVICDDSGNLTGVGTINTQPVNGALTVANATARLALTGLSIGAAVYQTDTGFFYTLMVAGGESTAGNWKPTPKVYRAVLTQTGTDAPVATVIEDTIIPPSGWLYDSVGAFVLPLNTDWESGLAADVFVLLGSRTIAGNTVNCFATVVADSEDFGGTVVYLVSSYIYRTAGSFQAAGEVVNGIIDALPIEILLYPPS